MPMLDDCFGGVHYCAIHIEEYALECVHFWLSSKGRSLVERRHDNKGFHQFPAASRRISDHGCNRDSIRCCIARGHTRAIICTFKKDSMAASYAHALATRYQNALAKMLQRLE